MTASKRWKKGLVFGLKLGVLVAALWWAGSQIAWRDALTPDGRAVPAGASTVRVDLLDGRAVELGLRDRLILVGWDGASGVVRLPDGSTGRIATSLAAGESASLRELPGVRSLLLRTDASLLLLALCLYAPVNVLLAWRWHLLLRASAVHIGFGSSLRLTWVGLFFNLFLVGGTGGDVIKAIGVARRTNRKAEAATMVLVDRIVGLVGLMLLAGGAALASLSRMGDLAWKISLVLVVLGGGLGLYFWSGFRRMIRLERMLEAMPAGAVLGRIDAAVYGLRTRPRVLGSVLLLTFVIQLVSILALFVAGWAIGLNWAGFLDYLVVIPIGFLANALPISVGGVGVMEGAMGYLFGQIAPAGIDARTAFAQGFMLSLVLRMVQLVWSLPGGAMALIGSTRADVAGAREVRDGPESPLADGQPVGVGPGEADRNGAGPAEPFSAGSGR